MIRFSLPETSASQPVAFRDAFLAAQWLTRQPQANVTAMLEVLTREIDAFNRFALPARERFKTLEALRKTVFTIGDESLRNFENRPLPLTPEELAAFRATARLWRCCTLGYLYCLNACLEGEPDIREQAGKVAHRAMTSLRMEQLCCYWANYALDENFWKELHAVYLAAEKLQALNDPVRDPLPKETAESTLTGQYGMAILTHLADPYSMQYSQLNAALQWIARWRELTAVQAQPQVRPAPYSIALDLTSPGEPAPDSPTQRRLSFGAIARKVEKRIQALKGGTPPEDLRLGKLMQPEAAIGLLEKLFLRLYAPALIPARAADAHTQPVEILCPLEDLYRLTGGTSLQESQPETSVARIKAERLAIFGHVADPKSLAPIVFERWLAVPPASGTTLSVQRDAAQDGKRLAPGNLLGIRQAPGDEPHLASITRLSAQGGQLVADISLLPGRISPLIAKVTEKISNATFQHPALLLTGPDNDLQAILPTGALARALRCRLCHGTDSAPLKLAPQALIERHGDSERWRLAAE